ncbi:MAG: CBS domain-containing protein [Chloroflexi bacterium]|nr:CBS domain-containing protein [Chloroflexota bacterium]MDA1004400.1 CBS domain-containing protein [Chloroflexota bacterium]
MPLSEVTVSAWMQPDVVTMRSDGSVRDALDLSLHTAYDCVVILDDARRPLGIVTEGDAIRRVLADEVPGGSYLRRILASPEAAIGYLREAERAKRNTAADIMTSPVHTVAATDSLLHVAGRFQSLNVRQLVVVTDGAVAGIITRRDLVRAIIAQHDSALGAPEPKPGT